jgi:hypothetical protein
MQILGLHGGEDQVEALLVVSPCNVKMEAARSPKRWCHSSEDHDMNLHRVDHTVYIKFTVTSQAMEGNLV